ncbi:tRNA uridine(34) 5-carboxymethylaminomethyl modification radical SAM/GNAT enzyme Elp3, partial [Candidatus Woesebacteria bacterium]|nr:tRNA uridine(34) 5-carboxymethylaminomethyl modification radical SAM/GNAT enzyme Elp3 [Candidatus Woesebacteria bacterium]
MLNNVTNHQLPLSLVALLTELATGKYTDAKSLQQLIKRFPKASSLLYSKSEILAGYRTLSADDISKKLPRDIERLLLLKPVRTQSGVAPVTVLTKPFPCPGKCIFCPNDIRMPKSYLADEPGAQRAERNWFDPYLQTYNRLTALHAIGHEVDKVELIILGGTWSFYPEPYQIWFISECFRALNEFGVSDGRAEVEAHYQQVQERLKQADAYTATVDPRENKEKLREREIMGEDVTATRHYNQVISELYVAPEQKLGISQYQTASWEVLEALQHSNEAAGHRCVGLVIETRPDCISEAEVIRIRRLGCTKAQIGFQSLQDSVLTANKRGHDVAATRRAVRLLRQAGFKIHAHWMANLYGSSVEKDIVDYSKMFSDTDFMPDELKIYPCSLIASAELMQHYKDGSWQPYTHDELLHVVTECIKQTPEYCRLTRVIRDIPSTDIVVGNKLTNFRQVAERSLAEAGEQSKDIRAREIRRELFDEQALKLQVYEYSTSVSTELFLQFVST